MCVGTGSKDSTTRKGNAVKLTNKKLSTVQRALVFGPPKVGKTQLVSELAKSFYLDWFDLENGYATLLKLPEEARERIEIFSIPDTKVFPIAIETMLKVITGNKTEICHVHGKVSCPLCKAAHTKGEIEAEYFSAIELNTLPANHIFVVDSLTQLAVSTMNHLTKTQGDLYKPEWPDYRNQGQLMDKFLSQVAQASYNVVCISHELEIEQESGVKKLVPVSGTTNFSRNTSKYFDHVVYCDIKNGKHIAASKTTYSNAVQTGSRTDVDMQREGASGLLEVFKTPRAAPLTPGMIAAAQLKGV